MSTSLSPLLAPMLSSGPMRTVCDDATTLQHMLDFEAALARAEAAAGVIPKAAADSIAKACKAEAFDNAALAEAATRSGNLAIPFVKALTARVAEADAEAARYVHWGATSQDVIDTATMLSLRKGIDALLTDIDRAVAGFAGLARRHRQTAVVARTWLQHALPMPFGLKLAEYAAALHRSRTRLMRLRGETLALQFGGAAGTLAALGGKGLEVAERLAGKPLALAMEERLFRPLGMRHTLLPDANVNTMPEPYSHGYLYGSSSVALVGTPPYSSEVQAAARTGTLLPNDYTDVSPSFALAAGGVVSTANDLATWIRALAGGQVLNAEYQARWRDSLRPEDKPDGQEYGYGITRIRWASNEMLFHGGETAGYQSFIGYDPANGVTLVVWTNLAVSLDEKLTANELMLRVLDHIYRVSPLRPTTTATAAP